MPKITESRGATSEGVSQTRPQVVLVRGARLIVYDGKLAFADGSGALPDVSIERDPATGALTLHGVIALTGALAADSDLTVTGTLTALGYFGAGGNLGLGSGVSEIGFFGATAVTKPTVSGARNTPEGALASLLTALATLGLITNSTTAT